MTMIYLYEKMPEIGIRYLKDVLKKVEKDLEKLSEENTKSFTDLLNERSLLSNEYHYSQGRIEGLTEHLKDLEKDPFTVTKTGKAHKISKEKELLELKESFKILEKKFKKLEKDIEKECKYDTKKWDKEFQKKQDLKSTKKNLETIISNLSSTPAHLSGISSETLFDED